MTKPAEMKCRACGWWPPMVRERTTGDYVRVVRASESWRWRQLRRHIYEVSADEYDDGPHEALIDEIERQ